MTLKKIGITISLFCVSFILTAQSEYNYQYSWPSNINYFPIEYKPIKNVKQITFIQTDSKAKIKTYVKKYDNEGRFLEYLLCSDDGTFVPKQKYGYDSITNKINKVEIFADNGKLKTCTNYISTEKGIPLVQETKNSKGKITSKNTWKYNEKGNLIESKRYKKGGEIVQNTWVYEFNDKGEKTRSMILDSKGKIQHEWTFDCKEEGAKLEKKENQTQVCNWKVEDGKYLIFTHQAFDEKGEIRKYVTKYSIEDTLIVEASSYNNDDELISKSTYDKSYIKMLTSEGFKNGKTTYKIVYEYSGDLVIKRENKYLNGYYELLEYTYNEDNLLIELKRFKKDNKLKTTTKLVYVL